jgi:hypothetical protein
MRLLLEKTAGVKGAALPALMPFRLSAFFYCLGLK